MHQEIFEVFNWKKRTNIIKDWKEIWINFDINLTGTLKLIFNPLLSCYEQNYKPFEITKLIISFVFNALSTEDCLMNWKDFDKMFFTKESLVPC